MSRKRKAPIRKVYADPKFKSEIISKFINSIMYDGKRSTAEKILYDALDKIKSKNSKFFFGAAIFFYLMIFWIPMLSRVYFIAGTICLFLQYLVSIGKVEISQAHDNNSGSSSDFDHP